MRKINPENCKICKTANLHEYDVYLLWLESFRFGEKITLKFWDEVNTFSPSLYIPSITSMYITKCLRNSSIQEKSIDLCVSKMSFLDKSLVAIFDWSIFDCARRYFNNVHLALISNSHNTFSEACFKERLKTVGNIYERLQQNPPRSCMLCAEFI